MARVMLASVHDPSRAANVPDEMAQVASDGVAGRWDGGTERRRDGIQAETNLLNWMVGANVALGVAILALLFIAG